MKWINKFSILIRPMALFFLSLSLVCSVAFAQEDRPAEAQEADTEVEALLDKEESKAPAPKPKIKEKKTEKPVQSLSDLANLSSFEDVAIIQRRFLPKTKRFELSTAGFSNLNNPYFNMLGINLRAAYYLREQYAIEALVNGITTFSRQVTDDLKSKRNIDTDNVVTSRGFFGMALKWNPIYGKITWLNETIVPFDMNFNVGFGLTRTTDGENQPTLHLGTSQVFAMSKSMAFRWDLQLNSYNAEVTDQATGRKESLNQNDLFLGFGVSFYFPEAAYR